MKDARALIALIGVVFVAMTGFGAFLPIFPFLGLQVHATPTQVTIAMGAYSFGQLIAAPLWGRLSDRVGRKPVLIAGLAASGLSYLMLAGADTILMIGAARLFAGLMSGNMGAAFAAAADLADDRTRARNMGLLGAAAGTAFIAGPAIGALMVAGAEHGGAYARVCYASAGLAFGAMLLALALFRETLPPERRRPVGTPRPRTFAILRTRPLLRLYAFVMLLAVTAQAMMESIFGLWADAEFHWGAHEVGWTLAAIGAGAALVQGGGAGAAARRVGEHAALGAGLLLSAIGFVLIAYAKDLWLAGPACVFLVLGFGLTTPAMQSLIAGQGREADRGVVMGVAQSAGALGRVLGPASSGAIFDAFGPDAPFFTAVILLALAFAVTLSAREAPSPAPSSAAEERDYSS